MKDHNVTIQELAGHSYTSLICASSSTNGYKKIEVVSTIGTNGNVFSEFCVTVGGKRVEVNNAFSIHDAIEAYNNH